MSVAAPATYDTPNGKKTLQQMQDGLHGAGWNGNYNDAAAVIAAYNSTASGASAGGGASGGTESSAQKLLDAIASGDQAKFDEAVREFDKDFAEKQREFNTSNYTDLAKSLLGTAAGLRGPADYYQYQQYASGGRDLFKSLYGNQPMPAFNSPAGTNQPASVEQLLKDLGITVSPISSTATAAGAPAGSYNTINGPKTLAQMYSELKAAGWGGTNPNDAAGITAAYASTTKGPVTPGTDTGTQANTNTNQTTVNNQAVVGNKGAFPVTTSGQPTSTGVPANSGVHPIFNSASTSGQPATPSTGNMRLPTTTNNPQPVTPSATDFMSGGAGSSNSGLAFMSGGANNYTPAGAATPSPVTSTAAAATSPTTSTVPTTPNGYQVNPAVWDSLSGTQKALVQSAVEAGGGVFSDWLAQLNASRPQGNAPSASTTSFATPMGSFS